MTKTQAPQSGCCAPSNGRDPSRIDAEIYPVRPVFFPQPTVPISGSKGLIGTNSPQIPVDGEGPLRRKSVKPFRMTDTTITNAAFAKFVDETGYVTEAEEFGWSFVLFSDVPAELGATEAVAGTEWWRRVHGAHWRDIHGPNTRDRCLPDHPVVHVSWRDASAFAAWCGGRLPSELEWEHAARAGQGDVRFPWGDAEPDDHNFMPCNIWQGRFPDGNTGADGWHGTAPAKSFEPNDAGLYNMAGNVWEWTADLFRIKSLKKSAKERERAMRGYRVLKGGSFMCHISYCYRYRIAARIGNSPDTSTPHQGFRVVWDD